MPAVAGAEKLNVSLNEPLPSWSGVSTQVLDAIDQRVLRQLLPPVFVSLTTAVIVALGVTLTVDAPLSVTDVIVKAAWALPATTTVTSAQTARTTPFGIPRFTFPSAPLDHVRRHRHWPIDVALKRFSRRCRTDFRLTVSVVLYRKWDDSG